MFLGMCQKCWDDAGLLSQDSGKPQVDHYTDLMDERRANPCTPEQQGNSALINKAT